MHLTEKRKANSLDETNGARFDYWNGEHSCQRFEFAAALCLG
jgi:hypothetical protein